MTCRDVLYIFIYIFVFIYFFFLRWEVGAGWRIPPPKGYSILKWRWPQVDDDTAFFLKANWVGGTTDVSTSKPKTHRVFFGNSGALVPCLDWKWHVKSIATWLKHLNFYDDQNLKQWDSLGFCCLCPKKASPGGPTSFGTYIQHHLRDISNSHVIHEPDSWWKHGYHLWSCWWAQLVVWCHDVIELVFLSKWKKWGTVNHTWRCFM